MVLTLRRCDACFFHAFSFGQQSLMHSPPVNEGPDLSSCLQQPGKSHRATLNHPAPLRQTRRRRPPPQPPANGIQGPGLDRMFPKKLQVSLQLVLRFVFLLSVPLSLVPSAAWRSERRGGSEGTSCCRHGSRKLRKCSEGVDKIVAHANAEAQKTANPPN